MNGLLCRRLTDVSYDRDPYTSHAQEFVFYGSARIILLVKINLLAIDP
jgi:hypothetical protein